MWCFCVLRVRTNELLTLSLPNVPQPQPGDYTYSGMHDHGPLPLPKEGGQFAQLIGFVNAAKKASDRYLTELIEREKMLAAAKKATGAVEGDGDTKQQKSKRKRGAAKS